MKKIFKLSSHTSIGEKKGNISWVQCNACDNWFHATSELINAEKIKLHCPNCHIEFYPEDSKKIIIA